MLNGFHSILDSKSGYDTLPLRLALGVIFFAHGSQKLFGFFGGYGLEGTAGWMDSIGLSPGLPLTILAGSAEFFGGAALLAGAFVRPMALILAFTMAVAIAAAHLANGFFMSNNGYEFGLALLAGSLALALRGAGSLSADRWLSEQFTLRPAFTR